MSLRPYVHLDASLEHAEPGRRAALSEGERHHLYRVLRATDGTELEVADGAGWSASGRLTQGEVTLTTAATYAAVGLPRLHVAQGLPKARKLDEVVRQLTELGVDALTAVATERSVTRLEGAKALKAQARWEAVARAACEQARRPRRPRLTGVVSLDSLLDEVLAADAAILVGQPHATPLPDALPHVTASEVVLAIGPEGGWSPAELARLTADERVHRVGLGPTVLRTEHAAAAALAVASALLGRWGGAEPHME